MEPVVMVPGPIDIVCTASRASSKTWIACRD
jgi:hypothetical protein